MTKRLLFSAFVTCLLTQAQAQTKPDPVTQRVFLIGDAGELVGNTHPVVDWLQKNVNWNDSANSVIWLGDNIYPLGLPMVGEPDYLRSKKIIDYQISLNKGKRSKAFFIPGNHDWKNGKLGGWQQVRNQHNYINGQELPNIQSLPVGGCPGPIAVDISPQVVGVFIDSQWFLYVHDKPGPGSACPARTVDEFATELREIVAAHPNQLMILATHHPMYSFGVHGGDYTWKEHLFPLTAVNPKLYIPLPVLGSIYPITRGVFGNLQDVNHPLYQGMVSTIENVIKDHPNVITVAGHDHSLQLIQRDSMFHIVSGSGSNLSRVKENRRGQLVFRDLMYGFVLMEVTKSGKVTTKFYNINSKDMASPTFEKQLYSMQVPPLVARNEVVPRFPDSATAAANPQFKDNWFKATFFGGNYRKEWRTPVTVPVLNLGTEAGGLTPEKVGGGKQTKSLRMVAKNGKDYVLRSVQKYPDAAVPADLRQTALRDVVDDGVSASYPFAGLSVGPLAKAAGVPYLERKLVYIPDDPRLGRYRETFKNTLATLEEREPAGVNKSYNTEEIVLRLAKDNDDHINQLSVLKARLLDNFYMDLDRHEDQWRWVPSDTGKGKVYSVVPKDQDQAFFVNKGLVPDYIKKPWLVPQLQGFRARADNINTFNKPARNFDRFFLTELDKAAWTAQIDSFLTRMTDAVIEDAMNKQPREIKGFRYNSIVNKLKKRRQYFKHDMLEYYGFISRQVNVVGTNQRELFTINKQPDNKVQVVVNKIDKSGAVSSKTYERLFDPAETKEINIYGLDGADSFVVAGAGSRIKIRIIGGSGADAFASSATGAKVTVYDVTFEENTFTHNSTATDKLPEENGFKKRLSPDPRNNEYSRQSFTYGYFNPSIAFGFNADDGLLAGVKGELLVQGFRKDPFKSRHVLRAGHALRTSSYYFGYTGEFTKALGSKDLLIDADLRAPLNVTNFFGFGNSTTYTRAAPGGLAYYRTRYNLANVAVMARKQLQSWMRVKYGPVFQYIYIDQDNNKGRFLTNSFFPTIDYQTLYDPKLFAGAQLLLDINSKNNTYLPTRGFVLDAGVKSLVGLNSQSNRLTQLHWDMSVFASFARSPGVVYAARLGVAHNIGAFEIPQAQYLSGTENLRGFRRNRFAGRTLLFQNTEVRIKLTDFTTYLFPGSLGIALFHDVGRVWQDAEKSTRWHNGYGAGLWVAPIKRLVGAVYLAHSKEEKVLPYVSVGFRF